MAHHTEKDALTKHGHHCGDPTLPPIVSDDTTLEASDDQDKEQSYKAKQQDKNNETVYPPFHTLAQIMLALYMATFLVALVRILTA